MMDYIAELQSKYGERFNAVIAQRAKNGMKDLAWVTPSRELVINPDYFNSREALGDILKELSREKILPMGCGNIGYVARHEYAHLITVDKVSEPHNKVVTKFGRMKPKEFISKNAMKSPYEFVADYLAILEDNKTSKELKTMFKWSD
jgi:hypothetical protein